MLEVRPKVGLEWRNHSSSLKVSQRSTDTSGATIENQPLTIFFHFPDEDRLFQALRILRDLQDFLHRLDFVPSQVPRLQCCCNSDRLSRIVRELIPHTNCNQAKSSEVIVVYLDQFPHRTVNKRVESRCVSFVASLPPKFLLDFVY